MARIRSIKPEFPQSETIGSMSRDARLLFIQLWTVVDDDGRTRAASRMLASLLYPYDDDANALIDSWLEELERLECIRRYEVSGSRYLEITNWRKHQKIDKPTVSRLPAFDVGAPVPREPSRTLATDLGPRTKDQDHEVSPPSEARPPDDGLRRNSVGEAVNVASAISAFNQAAERAGWPKARSTTQRSVALRLRLAELGGLEVWTEALTKAEGSPFLCGDNERGWKLDLDFLLKPKNLNKLMEGGYDRSTRAATGSAKPGPHETFLRSIARAVEKRDGLGSGQADADGGIRDQPRLPPPAAGMADDLEIPGFLRRQ